MFSGVMNQGAHVVAAGLWVVQTWTLGREQTSSVASMLAKMLSTSSRETDSESARKRAAERAALAITSSGVAICACGDDGTPGVQWLFDEDAMARFYDHVFVWLWWAWWAWVWFSNQNLSVHQQSKKPRIKTNKLICFEMPFLFKFDKIIVLFAKKKMHMH